VGLGARARKAQLAQQLLFPVIADSPELVDRKTGDPWWNPAVEAQAIDRTHRIGQMREVFAYRLVAEDTIESRILELQERKRAVADAVLGESAGGLRSLDREDLELLLS
jgi:SNF2 family DNA or RNA helicase